MSRERELLERAIDEWDSDRDLYEFHKVMEEVRDFLSTPEPEPEPEQDAEPVAWTCQNELNALGTDVTCYMYAEPLVGEKNIPLYLHPAPRQEFVRLSEEEVNSLTYAPLEPYELICAVENMLVRKNIINKSDPDSVDLQSRCRGDKL